MNQTILPLIPHGATPINAQVGVFNEGGHWVYLLGMHPIYRHRAGDQRGFRLTIAQLVDSQACRASEVCGALGIAKSRMDRALRLYRAGGIDAFFGRKPAKRAGRVLTAERLVSAQELLDEGLGNAEVAARLGVPADTLRRAVWDGRLKRKDDGEDEGGAGSDKSQRSVEDAVAGEGMGTGCTRAGERMLAALGALDGAAVRFEHARQVPFGGVLCALGALLANGLLGPARECLGKIRGYYTANHILLLLAFMGLCRIKTTEKLRGKAPGELGKLMGLDRVPEVRCLRGKLDAMSRDEASEKYAASLSRQWMEAEPEAVGTLYVDGHVRVYHGSKTKLPRKYVSRQRLCLRGTTDYWVNALDGRPFFLVSQPVDPGLIQVLRTQIVPRLLADAPDPLTEAERTADPGRHHFTLVFDRAGYSPEFFAELKALRVAVLTYHKFAGEDWALEEFLPQTLTLANGESVTLALAERGTRLSNGLWVREIRQREASGHQVSVLSTDYRSDLRPLAMRIFARWTQENFLKYMREHYAIDRLVEYGTEPLPETTMVVNPARRQLESQIRRERALRDRDRAAVGALSLSAAPEPPELEAWQHHQARLHEALTAREAYLEELQAKRPDTPRHVALKDLPKEEQFPRLRAERKHFVDTIKLIAYRAETALVGTVREALARNDDGRALVRELLGTPADLHPDLVAKTLTVRLHPLPSRLQDAAARHLAEELTATETVFPGTDLRLIFTLNGPS